MPSNESPEAQGLANEALAFVSSDLGETSDDNLRPVVVRSISTDLI